MNQDRENAVKALVEYSNSLALIREKLEGFPWDYQGDTVKLSQGHIINVLNRYLNGTLSTSDIEEWAELIEGRDDISFVEESENWIAETLYELANPYLTELLTPERAQAIIKSA